MRFYLFFVLWIILFSSNVSGQNPLNDFGFEKILNVPVTGENFISLANAWGGGLNSCQYGAVDLDLDGIKDLVVFDRLGNRILTFINNGIPGTISYFYAPQYVKKIPYLHDWVQFYDYNCDGKTDIFTYSDGGIAVYINESFATNGLLFKLKTPLLNSLQGSIYTSIFLTSVDYPAISDIDNDGDLDILTFFGLGSYVEYHKNLSKELYGNCDSLKFQLVEYCWGEFSEGESNNSITLNISCPYSSKEYLNEPFGKYDEKHTGSTLLALDLDGDLDKDLIIGDVDYPNLIALTNGGDVNNAFMVSMDTLFPSNTNSVNLFSFPSASLIDLNNDNKNDLLVSPFDGNNFIAENKQSCWLFSNSGTDFTPVFDFQIPDFLQSEMIDVGTCAFPVLFDYDHDGLTDLFVGNYGYRDTSYYNSGMLITHFKSQISLFKNIGTQILPQFQLITDDFATLSSLDLIGLYPAFGDIDQDEKDEMLIGNADGKLLLFKNVANIGSPPNFVLQQTNFENIDVGDFSTPQLIDLNRDNLLDLVIGEKGYRKGNLNYYKNTGTNSNPVFTLITDSLGGVDVCDHATSNFGYSVPCFFEDTVGRYKLFVGSELGRIHYYKNIENNLNGIFTQEDDWLLYIYEGSRTGVAVNDLNNDGFLDMIVGNFSGGLGYFKGTTPQPHNIKENFAKSSELNLILFPNPANKMVNLNIESEFSFSNAEVQIFNYNGKVVYENFINNKSFNINVSDFPSGIYIIKLSVIDKAKNKAFSVCKKLSITH